MTAIANTINTIARPLGVDAAVRKGTLNRAVVIALFAGVALTIPGGIAIAADALTDAYLAVSVFVAATLIVLHAAQRLFNSDLVETLARHRTLQVPAGALLGTLPGCGGAIVAVTQFTRGTISFGGVVATLTSTMGDAMFLLLAREPSTAGLVMVVGVAAGIVSGYLVDAIHGQGYLQPEKVDLSEQLAPLERVSGKLRSSEALWYGLFVPGLVLGVLQAFQVEIDNPLVATVGVSGALLSVAMWLMHGGENRECQNGVCKRTSFARKVIDDTNFITAWVVFAFVGYELLIHASGVDLGTLFETWAVAVPAMAILVGLIPGCGPQIVTTSLYLDGDIPLSAQLGNAISNDGDALFPAIAKAPRVALLATLYTMVPAIVIGYGAYALGY